MIVKYEVWYATTDDMVRYGEVFRTFEEAKQCADQMRKTRHGTILVRRIQQENIYEA